MGIYVLLSNFRNFLINIYVKIIYCIWGICDITQAQVHEYPLYFLQSWLLKKETLQYCKKCAINIHNDVNLQHSINIFTTFSNFNVKLGLQFREKKDVLQEFVTAKWYLQIPGIDTCFFCNQKSLFPKGQCLIFLFLTSAPPTTLNKEETTFERNWLREFTAAGQVSC